MREPLPEDRSFKRRPRILDYLGAGGLFEDEAQETADAIVRSVRGPEGASAMAVRAVAAGRYASPSATIV